MALQENIFLILIAGIFVLVLINAILLWLFYTSHRKINQLLEKNKVKNLKDIFLSQKDKNDDLDKKISQAFSKIKDLEDISKITIQKTGVVRFNPFNDLGGNQSFVIALLDGGNSGFVISSLFAKEGNRVYAKAIKNGKSDFLLSAEEIEAINRAIG